MTDPIACLLQAHHTCDDLLERVEAAARRADWPAARDRFHEAEQAMLGHFELEEERLFPAFEQATGIVHGPTAVMRDEHEAMRDLLESCRSLLLLEDEAALQAELDTLFIMVQQHNVKEENVLYPLCRARLPDLAALLAEPVPALPA